MKKVGRTVYGSGDTLVLKKLAIFFSGPHVGGGGLYAILYGTCNPKLYAHLPSLEYFKQYRENKKGPSLSVLLTQCIEGVVELLIIIMHEGTSPHRQYMYIYNAKYLFFIFAVLHFR